MLAICSQNARRSQEIVTYTAEEYFKDLGMYEREQTEAGEEAEDILTMHFMQHKTQKNKKAAIAIVSGLVREALYYYITTIRPFLAPTELKTVFFSNYNKPLSYSNLNKDLTRMYRLAYPGTNYSISTRTFRKVYTTYGQQEVPELVEGIASLLCHDVSTAKQYYDVRRGISAAMKTKKTLTQQLRVTTQQEEPPAEEMEPATSLAGPTTTTTLEPTTTATTPAMSSTPTTCTTTADTERAGPSTARCDLESLLEKLQEQKMTPKEKFLIIFEMAGPVRLPYKTLQIFLNASQRKNGRARNTKLYESVLASYKVNTQDD